jgi:hypothetical protein
VQAGRLASLIALRNYSMSKRFQPNC